MLMPKIKCTASVLQNFNGESQVWWLILVISALHHTEVRQEDCLKFENNLVYIDLVCLCPCPPPHTQKRSVIVKKKLLRFSFLFCLSVYFKIDPSIPPREIFFNFWHKVMVVLLQDQESKPPYLISEAPCSMTAFPLRLNGTLPWSVRMLHVLY